ncbi:MAG: hypothetical protein AAB515_04070 [Patescibacteria group bacterium]
MFLHTPPNPTKAKHVIYLAVTTALGILLSYLVHAGIEAAYLAWAESAGREVTWYGGPLDTLGASCALHPVIQVGLIVLGAIGGFLLGRYWWRLVYVERKWAKGKL